MTGLRLSPLRGGNLLLHRQAPRWGGGGGDQDRFPIGVAVLPLQAVPGGNRVGGTPSHGEFVHHERGFWPPPQQIPLLWGGFPVPWVDWLPALPSGDVRGGAKELRLR